MSTRFSPSTNFAILGLLPIPYSTYIASTLIKNIYFYSIKGAREQGRGNIGPVLFEFDKSIDGYPENDYRGTDMHKDDDWNFNSPISWHFSSTKASFLEINRNGTKRIRIAKLNRYVPQPKVDTQETPDNISYAYSIDKFKEIPPPYFYGIILGKDEINSNLTVEFSLINKTLTYNNYSIDGERYFSGVLKSSVDGDDYLGGLVEYNITMKNKKGKELGKSEFKFRFSNLTEFDKEISEGYAKYRNIKIDMDIYKKRK